MLTRCIHAAPLAHRIPSATFTQLAGYLKTHLLTATIESLQRVFFVTEYSRHCRKVELPCRPDRITCRSVAGSRSRVSASTGCANVCPPAVWRVREVDGRLAV